MLDIDPWLYVETLDRSRALMGPWVSRLSTPVTLELKSSRVMVSRVSTALGVCVKSLDTMTLELKGVETLDKGQGIMKEILDLVQGVAKKPAPSV